MPPGGWAERAGVGTRLARARRAGREALPVRAQADEGWPLKRGGAGLHKLDHEKGSGKNNYPPGRGVAPAKL